MSYRVAALSLYKHALRMSKQFDDLLVQRKVLFISDVKIGSTNNKRVISSK